MNLEEAGTVAWTYMELLLVEFIENEPADCEEGGGTVEKHCPVSYETTWPGVSVGDHRAVVSALTRKGCHARRRDFQGLT